MFFFIVYRDKKLYVQANNCVERKEWLDLLGKLCEGHSSQPQKYHRATYTHGQWNWFVLFFKIIYKVACLFSFFFHCNFVCFSCKLSNEDAIGCATVASKSCMAEIPLKFDPTRDLQRIHCLLYENITFIEQLLQGDISIGLYYCV